jgi:hypothetical protein
MNLLTSLFYQTHHLVLKLTIATKIGEANQTRMWLPCYSNSIYKTEGVFSSKLSVVFGSLSTRERGKPETKIDWNILLIRI